MKFRKKVLVGGFFFSLLIFIMSKTACAGEINGNEQTVLSIVSGEFEYKGINYKAAPGYIEKVRTYLSQDDIDLTAEQANEAVSEIYANIETGVTEGYIIPSNMGAKEKANASANNNQENADNQKKEEKKNTEEIVISTSSGMVEAIDEKGESLFVSESAIKDTGYEFTGVIFVLTMIVIGIGLCMMITIKYQLLAHNDEP